MSGWYFNGHSTTYRLGYYALTMEVEDWPEE